MTLKWDFATIVNENLVDTRDPSIDLEVVRHNVQELERIVKTVIYYSDDAVKELDGIMQTLDKVAHSDAVEKLEFMLWSKIGPITYHAVDQSYGLMFDGRKETLSIPSKLLSLYLRVYAGDVITVPRLVQHPEYIHIALHNESRFEEICKHSNVSSDSATLDVILRNVLEARKQLPTVTVTSSSSSVALDSSSPPPSPSHAVNEIKRKFECMALMDSSSSSGEEQQEPESTATAKAAKTVDDCEDANAAAVDDESMDMTTTTTTTAHYVPGNEYMVEPILYRRIVCVDWTEAGHDIHLSGNLVLKVSSNLCKTLLADLAEMVTVPRLTQNPVLISNIAFNMDMMRTLRKAHATATEAAVASIFRTIEDAQAALKEEPAQAHAQVEVVAKEADRHHDKASMEDDEDNNSSSSSSSSNKKEPAAAAAAAIVAEEEEVQCYNVPYGEYVEIFMQRRIMSAWQRADGTVLLRFTPDDVTLVLPDWTCFDTLLEKLDAVVTPRLLLDDPDLCARVRVNVKYMYTEHPFRGCTSPRFHTAMSNILGKLDKMVVVKHKNLSRRDWDIYNADDWKLQPAFVFRVKNLSRAAIYKDLCDKDVGAPPACARFSGLANAHNEDLYALHSMVTTGSYIPLKQSGYHGLYPALYVLSKLTVVVSILAHIKKTIEESKETTAAQELPGSMQQIACELRNVDSVKQVYHCCVNYATDVLVDAYCKIQSQEVKFVGRFAPSAEIVARCAPANHYNEHDLMHLVNFVFENKI
jgi:hypothetical protein